MPARSQLERASAFLDIARDDVRPAPIAERVGHFKEFIDGMPEQQTAAQAARCMDCGIPYCHTGCPVHNEIPDWNELVVRSQWLAAARNLHLTNNFPEITGRICPAPCEEACTLYLHDAPVTIKSIERAIADRAFAEGWITPQPAAHCSGKAVAIVGSGPTGLAAAQQLARCGHAVRVYERDARPGGLMRYGIPDFKLEKVHVDRRIAQLQAEGVRFYCNTTVGSTVSAREIVSSHDAVILACGAGLPRVLNVQGVSMKGVSYALAYLRQQNMRIEGRAVGGEMIDARGKNVIVIGSGDTACDCIGTAFRQGAQNVTQIDVHPMAPHAENKLMSWPFRPVKFRVSTSQAEGVVREFQTGTLELIGDGGRVKAVRLARIDGDRRPVPGTDFVLLADLVLIAIGFAGPDLGKIDEELDLSRQPRGTIAASETDYATNHPGVFAAGDIRMGPSLVVWAIREGRQAAASVDAFLQRSQWRVQTASAWHQSFPIDADGAEISSIDHMQCRQRRPAMKVKDAMHSGVDWVGPETPISELARLMRDRDVGSIPIGEDDRLVGMVTDRDIVCKGLARNGFDVTTLTARDVMTRGIHCCNEDDDLEKAMRHMEVLEIRRLPVISKSRRMVGMLSLGDIGRRAPNGRLAQCVRSVAAHHY